jgi:hypothetical protein
VSASAGTGRQRVRRVELLVKRQQHSGTVRRMMRLFRSASSVGWGNSLARGSWTETSKRIQRLFLRIRVSNLLCGTVRALHGTYVASASPSTSRSRDGELS